MTVRSIDELLAEAAANLPDNNTGLISPADVRNLIVDFLDTVAPFYGAILMNAQTIALSSTPTPLLPFSTIVEANAPAFVVSLAQGSVTRQVASAGVAGATTLLTISGAVSGPNNANVTVALYANGVVTPFRSSVTCSGTGDNVGFSLTGINYSSPGDAEYTVYAAATNASNYDFSNVVLVAQSHPVKSF
jgi:hypothetical protein